jgi:2-amino-4-hydroxy-6-hydroxymethyldihydropteridine diphosphokinase
MLVFLGLGSNIGDRAGNIKAAAEAIKSSPYFNNARVSHFYESSPIGPKQRNFINAALSAYTNLSAAELLKFSKETEKKLGRRQRKIKWGPRNIDIDILFYGKHKIKTKELNIPHAGIKNRLFVLAPLSDLAPGFKHPVFNKTTRAMKKELLLTYKAQKADIPVWKTK